MAASCGAWSLSEEGSDVGTRSQTRERPGGGDVAASCGAWSRSEEGSDEGTRSQTRERPGGGDVAASCGVWGLEVACFELGLRPPYRYQ